MILWKRAFLLGLSSWAIPFAISVAAFPLKRLNAPLFEALMTLVLNLVFDYPVFALAASKMAPKEARG